MDGGRLNRFQRNKSSRLHSLQLVLSFANAGTGVPIVIAPIKIAALIFITHLIYFKFHPPQALATTVSLLQLYEDLAIAGSIEMQLLTYPYGSLSHWKTPCHHAAFKQTRFLSWG